MTDFHALSAKALQETVLTRRECLSVLNAADEQVLDLLAAAFEVRRRYFGKTVRLQMLLNAKSGATTVPNPPSQTRRSIATPCSRRKRCRKGLVVLHRPRLSDTAS